MVIMAILCGGFVAGLVPVILAIGSKRTQLIEFHKQAVIVGLTASVFCGTTIIAWGIFYAL